MAEMYHAHRSAPLRHSLSASRGLRAMLSLSLIPPPQKLDREGGGLVKVLISVLEMRYDARVSISFEGLGRPPSGGGLTGNLGAISPLSPGGAWISFIMPARVL